MEAKMYKVEYAKSGRSSCKKCSGLISKDSVRVSHKTPSPYFDGLLDNWYHYHCIWDTKHYPTSTDEIDGLSNLKWEDQEKFNKRFEKASSEPKPKELTIQYAKSGGAVCRDCTTKIKKGEIRIGRMEYNTDNNYYSGEVMRYYHFQCVLDHYQNIGINLTVDMNGMDDLEEEDKEECIKEITDITGETTTDNSKKGKKRKRDEPASFPIVYHKNLKDQSNELWDVKSVIKDIGKADGTSLCDLNNIKVKTFNSDSIDNLVDNIVYGKPAPCPICSGNVQLQGDKYSCCSWSNEWSKCSFHTLCPLREPFEFGDYCDEEIYNKYKVKDYRHEVRLFPIKLPDDLRVVKSPSIHYIGKTMPNNLKKIITKLGGNIVTKTKVSNATILLSDLNPSDDDIKLIQDYLQLHIPIVDKEYIEECEKSNEFVDPQPFLIYYEAEKKEITPKKQKTSSSSNSSSSDSLETLKLSGAAAIDEDSGYTAESATILQEGDKVYSETMIMSDISIGLNGFYRLQIIKPNNSTQYKLFRRWGRVGVKNGGNKFDDFYRKDDAIRKFKDLFLEKTGNVWDYSHKSLEKKPGLFFPLDLDYSEAKDMKVEHPEVKSKLKKEVQHFVEMIFDIKMLNKTLVELKIDISKMPLGKISKNQISKAYSILNDLQIVINTKEIAVGSRSKKGMTKMIRDSKILEYCIFYYYIMIGNAFYNTIPHDFGNSKPPLIDTMDLLNEKIKLCDTLMDLSTTASLVNDSNNSNANDEILNPIDEHFNSLHIDMDVVDKDENDYDLITKYIKNTHGVTHNNYTLKLKNLYRVKRHAEDGEFEAEYGNHKLLWHGTRLSNVAGILSQGLRIAPPEAPVTGYMFGKGVYFADMVSKSANYCYAGYNNGNGIMFLCDVSLGKPYQLKHSEYVEKLPAGCQCTEGIGRYCPDFSHEAEIDGAKFPCLKPAKETNIRDSSLLYNEWIVYNTKQIKIKYVLEVEFLYK